MLFSRPNLKFILIPVLIFLTSSVITAFQIWNETKLKQEEVPANTLEASNYPQNINPKIEPEQSEVCEYVDAIHEDIYEPDPDEDDIQDIIGYQNNKVGIYIYAEVKDFVKLADELVNSNGGEWGYVLIPYNVKEENSGRWGDLFERLNEKKLIPIIQLWDLDLDEDKMDKQINQSAEFLNLLEWPIKNRYVSVYNEPNDANFWKGKVNPEQYAEVLEKTINSLKSQNSNFFVLNGAFNASARTEGHYLDEREFLKRMNNQVPGIFKRLDGWASHPYPQPNFSGPVNGTGRDSIRAYEWELNILKTEYGVDISKLPVFITETGWAHIETDSDDGNQNGYKFNMHQVADNIKAAYEKVWLPDKRVVAVTPFTIRYDVPFDHFSWITKNNKPYPQFVSVQSIEKVEGKPPSVIYTKSKILECKYEYLNE